MSCKYCELKLDKEELEFGYSQHTCGVDAGISDIKYCPFCGDRLEVKEAK